MQIEIEHETTYEFSAPVRLGHQTVRLRPRPGGAMREIGFVLDVDPAPSVRLECLDVIGNRVVRLRFAGETRHLRLAIRLAVETGLPTDYVPFLEPGQARLPPVYSPAVFDPLALYLAGPPAARDPAGTLPVEGSYFGTASSRMEFALTIRAPAPALDR